MKTTDWSPILSTLSSARSFEEAAEAALDAAIAIAGRALEGSAFAGKGKVLRGIVHIRPGGGYRHVFQVEAGASSGKGRAGGRASEPPQVAVSATAFHRVVQKGRPIAVDVTLGTFDLAGGEGGDRATSMFDGTETQQRLLGRDVTHFLALPLRSTGGSVDGMLCVEATCRSAIGRPFIWPDCREHLQMLAGMAAPYLTTLPRGVVAAPAADELLPVVGASMAEVVSLVAVFARQEETVLIAGPTGAGKSRLSRWCHERSARKGAPFETLDLSTVPEPLQMAELVGWKKGAFTGAVKDTQGAVSRAEGGTLFIDEIDKLSLSAQVGLLRLLEEQRYRPLGASTAELSANVRFIAGTNADLAGAVRTGVFREDLYYRINVLPVKVPPLKDRVDEIVPWAEYMLSRRHSGASKEGSARLTPGAGHVLSGQPWPGNLRQLDNILRRAYALAQMGHDAPPKDVLLDAPHVERALAYEGGAEPNALLERMHQAAVAFVLEAERRQEAGMPLLDLDLADAMRGLILGAASEKLGNKEDAFRLVGKDSTVQSRNQQKILRRELEKVEALYREMGREGGSPFRALLGPDERG